MELNEAVIVRCYNAEESLTRKEAIRKYTEALYASEGSEAERYTNVLKDLYCGKHYCTD